MNDTCATWFGRALSYCCESGDVSTDSILSRLAWEISHGVSGDLDSVALVFHDSFGTFIVGHPREGDTLPVEVLHGFLIEQEEEPLSCRVRDHALDSLRFFGKQLRTSITIRLQHCKELEPSGEAIIWFGVAGIATPKRIQVAQDVARSLNEWIKVYCGVIKSHRMQTDEIEALQASRREMVTIAHDVRAPISTLQYLMSDLGEGDCSFIGEKKQICDELRYVNRLLEGLAPKRKGHVAFSAQVATALSEVLVRVVDRFGPEAKQRGAGISTAIGKNSSTLVAINELDLERILSNIIGNAVRYGGTGTVYINGIEGDAQVYTLEVLDEGDGFPTDVLDELRGGVSDARHDRVRAGWGVGLQATQRLLRRYGGDLCVSNTEVGGRALLRLPTPERSSSSVSQPIEQCSDEYRSSFNLDELPQCAIRELVIVDDDREHAVSLERIVSKKGITARIFTSVNDALSYLGQDSNRKQTCVVCDIHMPDGGADTLLNKLEAAPHNISCAVMSGEAPDEELYRFAARNAREFFSKPIDISGLLEWIESEERQHRMVSL